MLDEVAVTLAMEQVSLCCNNKIYNKECKSFQLYLSTRPVVVSLGVPVLFERIKIFCSLKVFLSVGVPHPFP